ncbi:MAG: efflux RND transporter periplasmic adaptor subunit [Oligoflexia bacterium]|nr:efflux RND transporter periplasmic adaptor subunit [Oligoflexia bacterium]
MKALIFLKRTSTLLASLSLIALSSCGWFTNADTHGPVEKLNPTTLRVYKDALDNLKLTQAHVGPFPELLSLMGKISLTEDRTTIIPSRVAGRIESIFFASGESVSQGQVLATLFSPDFVAAKEEYLQSLKQARIGNTSGADPSDFANLAQMARKKLETMGLSTADIDALKDSPTADPNKSLMLIRAPRSGVLIQKSAVLGNLVNVGDTLFMIGDLSKVWFSGDIYPEDLPKVRKNQDVFINAVGVDKPLYGKVSFISPLVDPNTRSIKIRAMMDNPKNALKADEYVQGNVILSQKDALTVPTQSIVRTPEGTVVFKRITPPSVEKTIASLDFQKIPVTTGTEQQGMTAVTQGLQNGDVIVSDGAWLLDAALNSAEGK